MILVEGKIIEHYDDGSRLVDALICSDTVPAKLPTSGADVQGMGAKDKFAPLSMIYVVDADAAVKMYLANESGEFIAQ